MKKIIQQVLALLLPFLATFSVSAFSPHLDGTMMPYDFETVDSVVPWNSDLKPVFVNYIARHGARFLSSAKKTEALKSRLEEARRQNRITAKGTDFLNLLYKVDSVTDGRWGALNALGIEEESRLGHELASTAPELFKTGQVVAESSYVPRVVMTMYEFCHSLAQYSSDLEITTTEGKNLNPLLRYFTTDKPYVDYLEQGPWRYAYEAYARTTLPVNPAAGMINEVVASKELQKLSLDAYGVLQSLRAAGIETDPAEWFTEEEYADCWKVSNLKHYYQRSVSTFSPLPAECAKPLLQRMVSNADKAFNSASLTVKPNENTSSTSEALKAELLFGHAETVIPLFALMKLPGCYSPYCEPDAVAAQWKDWEVSPLGANLMMVCLEDTNGNDYVSLRLNGKWVEIEGKKVIPWSALQAYWSLTH
ncbi:MAG: histidine phosphatase family protein [Muribaculaceae bacterium]|nr:histidine phosphatase family protein [Muribaculaceae bacterium]